MNANIAVTAKFKPALALKRGGGGPQCRSFAALRPLFIAGKVFGLSPYKCFTGRSPVVLQRQCSALVFSTGMVALLVSLTALKIWLRLSQMVHARSPKQTVLLVLKDCVSLLTIGFAVYKDVFGNNKKFEFIFNNLENAHAMMCKDESGHDKMRSFIKLQLGSSLSLLTSLFIYGFLVQKYFFERLVLTIGQLMVYIMIVICLRFVNFVTIVGNHFKELCKCIAEPCEGVRVRELRAVYEALSDVVLQVVAAHDPAITCGLGYFLVTVIHTAYAIAATDEAMLLYSAVQLLNCVFLLVLVLPVHVAQAHAAHVTRSVARSLLLQRPRGDAERELQLFLQTVGVRRVVFCAAGVIRLDLSLLAAFVGTLTTYMVLFFTLK